MSVPPPVTTAGLDADALERALACYQRASRLSGNSTYPLMNAASVELLLTGLRGGDTGQVVERFAPLHHCTTAPLHHCTTAPLHHCTTAPLHHLAPFTVHDFGESDPGRCSTPRTRCCSPAGDRRAWRRCARESRWFPLRNGQRS
ncbi:hypothetical protein [Streptomyces sp. NPDC018833]|uniref:hypothetical protein n=1 Tax=Streptomyces sp. NPDC018833 TaxID=3365053 RepID=UPI0037875894